MDTPTLILAVLVAVAVLGQLCLPLVGDWSRRRQLRILRERRAHLLEAAADRQLQQSHGQDGTFVKQEKGVGDAN